MQLLLLLIIPLMSWLSALSGGNGGAKRFLPEWGGGIPEILFGLGFGLCAFATTDSVVWGILAWAWSWLWMESGHGNFYHDGVAEHSFKDEPEKLEIITGMHWLLPRLGLPPRSKWYCRIMMALKWGLIGIPAFPGGLLLIVMGPVAYAIAFRVYKSDSMPAEWISGAAAGMAILIAITIAG